MGKNRNCDKDYSEIQTLRYQLQKLKKENSSLKKQLARIDLDRYSTVKDMIREYRDTEDPTVPEPIEFLEEMKKEWACKMPGCPGHLEIILYSKIGNPHYFRKCSECSNRTPSQAYVPSKVRGPLKPPPES